MAVTARMAGEAPYAAIITTVAAPRIPTDLLAQLAIDGRLIIPVGALQTQQLYQVTRRVKGNEIDNLGGCRFVSLIGQGAREERERKE